MNKIKEITDEANLIFNNTYNYIELFKKNNINFLKIECKNMDYLKKIFIIILKRNKDVHYVQNHQN